MPPHQIENNGNSDSGSINNSGSSINSNNNLVVMVVPPPPPPTVTAVATTTTMNGTTTKKPQQEQPTTLREGEEEEKKTEGPNPEGENEDGRGTESVQPKPTPASSPSVRRSGLESEPPHMYSSPEQEEAVMTAIEWVDRNVREQWWFGFSEDEIRNDVLRCVRQYNNLREKDPSSAEAATTAQVPATTTSNQIVGVGENDGGGEIIDAPPFDTAAANLVEDHQDRTKYPIGTLIRKVRMYTYIREREKVTLYYLFCWEFYSAIDLISFLSTLSSRIIAVSSLVVITKQDFPNHGWYTGRIVSVEDDVYLIFYEDGDAEDLFQDEIEQWLLLYRPQDENENAQDDDMDSSPRGRGRSDKSPHQPLFLHRCPSPPRRKKKKRKVGPVTPSCAVPAATKKKKKPANNGSSKRSKQTVPRNSKSSLSLWNVADVDEAKFRDAHGVATTRIADYFLFCRERQMIWKRRSHGVDESKWTQDPLLKRYVFCNVYRELDRGTAFFHAYVVHMYQTERPKSRQKWVSLVLWAAYLYRLVNRCETFKKLGIPRRGEVSDFLLCAEQQIVSAGRSFFTSAHQTTQFKKLSEWLHSVASHQNTLFDSVVQEIFSATQNTDRLTSLKKLPGVGKFQCWQLLCDLQESRCFPSDDGHCQLGPGAQGMCADLKRRTFPTIFSFSYTALIVLLFVFFYL